MKRTLIFVLLIIVAVGVLAGAATGAFFWRFNADIPVVEYTKPANHTQARLQDLDYLMHLPRSDHSFSEDETERFKEHVEQLRDSADKMTNAEFAMGVMAAAAISDNGHTNAVVSDVVNSLNSLPVRFFWFGDGLYIVRARASHSELIGARVVRYDGKRPEALVKGLEPYFGGIEGYLRFRSPVFFSSPAAMHAVKLAKNPDQVSLTLEDADGTTHDVTIKTEERATPVMRLEKHPMPTLSEQETKSGHDWRFLNPKKVSSAHYSQNPDTFWWSEALQRGGVYIRLRGIFDDGDKSLTDWLSGLRKDLATDPADYLVLDLRSNYGGNYMLTRDFARNISDLVIPDGRVYLLTDADTFSAAIVTLAYAVHGAGERAVIVGTQIGDDEQFWAEGGDLLELPNSGLRISVATGYHDWENGCQDWVRCFWPNILLGVAAGPLDPDIVAQLTFADYSKGIDTPLQTVLAAEGVKISMGTDQ